MGLILFRLAAAWIICGVALFVYFIYVLQLAEERAKDEPELIPIIVAIYSVLENVGIPGLLAACLLLWPKSVFQMLRKKFWRS